MCNSVPEWMFCCMNYQVKPAAKQPVKKVVSSSEEDSSSDEVCFL